MVAVLPFLFSVPSTNRNACVPCAEVSPKGRKMESQEDRNHRRGCLSFWKSFPPLASGEIPSPETAYCLRNSCAPCKECRGIGCRPDAAQRSRASRAPDGGCPQSMASRTSVRATWTKPETSAPRVHIRRFAVFIPRKCTKTVIFACYCLFYLI